MFFDLYTGKISDNTDSHNIIWKADGYLFISSAVGNISIYMSYKDLSNFLRLVKNTDQYIQQTYTGQISFWCEDRETFEGKTTVIISLSYGLFVWTFSINIDILDKLIEFLESNEYNLPAQ